MVRHRIEFKYSGTEDDAAINLAFNKKKVLHYTVVRWAHDCMPSFKDTETSAQCA